MEQPPARHSLLLWAVFITVLALFFRTGVVHSDAIEIVKNEPRLNFPRGVFFILAAESNTQIDQVFLLHGVLSNNCMESQARQEVEIKLGKRVEVQWEWDLTRTGGLPPGVEVWWQWEIHDNSGTIVTTERQTVTIVDPKFEWREVQRGSIILQYSQGGSSFGQAMLDLAVASLDRLSKNAGLSPSNPIRMTIYPSPADMQGALVGLVNWAGGIAFPEYRVILIGIAPDERDWAQMVIPHELTHLVTEMRVFNCQGSDLPTWLHEGLAEYAEGPVPPRDRDLIMKALENEDLAALRSLAKGFSVDSRKAEVAYRQSRMLVTYLIEDFGSEKLASLMDSIQSGQVIDSALRGVYGLDTDGLDQTWRDSLGFGEAPEPNFATATPVPQRTTIPTFALYSPNEATPPLTPSVTSLPPTATAPVVTVTDVEAVNSATPTLMQPQELEPKGNRMTVWYIVGGFAGLAVVAALIILFLVPSLIKKN